MFKKLSISDDLKANDELSTAVESATRVLADTIGRSAGLVDVRWDLRTDERQRPVIRLILKDWTGEVPADFSVQELDDNERLSGRFYKLYGDLLQIRSHRLIDGLWATSPAGQVQ